MYVLNDKQMASCHHGLRLIRSHFHYCGLNGLGVYSSAGQKMLDLVESLDVTLRAATYKEDRPQRSRSAKPSYTDIKREA